MPLFKNNDAEIYHEVTGDGPPLLLIAGLASDSASWAPVASALAKKFTLIVTDNRGCGRTRASGAITIDQIVNDHIALLHHLEVSRVDILGHSMGGIIAQEIACIKPDLVSRLILASSAAKASARTISVINTLSEMRAALDPVLWHRAFFHWLFAASFFEREKAVEAAIAMALAYPHAQSGDDFERQVAALNAYEPTAKIPGNVGVHFVIGDEDKMVTVDEIRAQYAPIGAEKFNIIERAGHSVHWDKPDEFIELVSKSFLRG